MFNSQNSHKRKKTMRKLQFLITLILITCSFLQVASPTSPFVPSAIREAKSLLREGSITSDTMLIIKAKDILQKIHEQNSTHTTLYFLAQSEYELARIAFALKDDKKFDIHYNAAVQLTEKLLEEKQDWSEPYALLALLYGYKIAKNNFTAVTLGPKSYFLAQRAIELDDKNPRAWFVWGTIKFHMPAVFGGGTKDAIDAFKKSIELFRMQPQSDSLAPDWGYLDALLWLGWAYEKEERLKEALAFYKNALDTYPQANWIKSSFLIPLQKRHGNIE